jgi:hypothetical protein
MPPRTRTTQRQPIPWTTPTPPIGIFPDGQPIFRAEHEALAPFRDKVKNKVLAEHDQRKRCENQNLPPFGYAMLWQPINSFPIKENKKKYFFKSSLSSWVVANGHFYR